MSYLNAVDEFKSVGLSSRMDTESPHGLITMLFQGLLDTLARAKGSIERQEIAAKGHAISKSIAIVDGLRASVNTKVGGDLSGNLVALYDYIEVRLLEANTQADATLIVEVSELVRELKSGWDAIPPPDKKGDQRHASA